jgi:hypothetical protein
MGGGHSCLDITWVSPLLAARLPMGVANTRIVTRYGTEISPEARGSARGRVMTRRAPGW